MVFELFCKELRETIKERFKEPTLPQKLAIPEILAGKNILLISETGTGKSEACLLPIFNFLITQKPKPIAVLYITPLKALNRDLLQRMVWWSNKLGFEITVRHGDTSVYERKMQTEFPSHLFFITLETLQPILIGKKLREHLKNVKWVIIDEVHEIADSKRGIQLALALERLKLFCKNFQLIMLSATIGEPEKVAKFFSGEREVKIIEARTAKQIGIRVISPKPTLKDRKNAEKIFTSKETAARIRTLMDLISSARSNITFTNTREFAEILANRIKVLDRNFPIAVHHSSLSKEVRIEAEKELKEGKVKSIIATSSLQLGIDIGSVDLVLQYMSPREVTQLVQRVGRSGHELERVSKGIIIAGDVDDIFESAVIARKALTKELEKPKFHEKALDVLAHQLIGLTFDFGKIPIQKAYEIVKKAYPYRNLSYAEFLEVCKQLKDIGLIFLNDYIRKKRRGFEYYFSQLSTIPDTKQYKIFSLIDNSLVGRLDEEFVALHGTPNTNFIVKGDAWRIVSVEDDKVLVEPTQAIEAAIPAWEGELIPVPFEVAQEVGKLREIISEKLEDKEIFSYLRVIYPIDKNCAEKMVKIIRKQKAYGFVPTDKKILIEHYENFLIMHACFGTKVNETFGKFLTALLASRLGSISLKTDPYRIIIQFQDRAEKNLELIKEILFTTKPELLKVYLELSLAKSELFEWKFVHVAKRFGAMGREAKYSKSVLKKIIEEFANSPIYKETIRELETEKLDIEKAKKILKEIQEKKIEVVFMKGLSPLGKIGIIQRYAEIIPAKEHEIFKLFKRRIMNTKVKLVCLNCGNWSQTFSLKEMPEDIKCKKCEARFLGIINPRDFRSLKIIEKILKRRETTIEEKKRFERMKRTADLFLTYRKKAALVLAGRGIGPKTAIRILTRYHKDEADLLRDILREEKKFIQTRRFWKI
jgi:ATP-dependent Lhr-like helicase